MAALTGINPEGTTQELWSVYRRFSGGNVGDLTDFVAPPPWSSRKCTMNNCCNNRGSSCNMRPFLKKYDLNCFNFQLIHEDSARECQPVTVHIIRKHDCICAMTWAAYRLIFTVRKSDFVFFDYLSILRRRSSSVGKAEFFNSLVQS